MKFLKQNFVIIVVAAITISILILNIFFDIYPILAVINYLEGNKYYWVIPVGSAVILVLMLFKRNMNRKIANEKAILFSATIRTIQDLLQNSNSSMQLLIMDMNEEGVNPELIRNAEKNIYELNRLIGVLASIDPERIKLKELNENLSIIHMEEKSTPAV